MDILGCKSRIPKQAVPGDSILSRDQMILDRLDRTIKGECQFIEEITKSPGDYVAISKMVITNDGSWMEEYLTEEDIQKETRRLIAAAEEKIQFTEEQKRKVEKFERVLDRHISRFQNKIYEWNDYKGAWVDMRNGSVVDDPILEAELIKSSNRPGSLEEKMEFVKSRFDVNLAKNQTEPDWEEIPEEERESSKELYKEYFTRNDYNGLDQDKIIEAKNKLKEIGCVFDPPYKRSLKTTVGKPRRVLEEIDKESENP